MMNLVKALVKAQSEFKPIKKEQVNPFFHSKYADLDSVLEGVKEALLNNGLAVIQAFGVVEGKNTLDTMLYHVSGEFVKGSQLLDVKDATDPQKIASASTYARRYGLMAILGISAEDDDGNNASLNTKKDEQIIDAPKHVVKIVNDIIHISSLSNYAIGDLVEEVNAIIASKEEKKTKTKKDITHFTANGVTIAMWGKQPHIQVGDTVIFHGVKVSEFNKQKQYSAQQVTLEQRAALEKDGNEILLGE